MESRKYMMWISLLVSSYYVWSLRFVHMLARGLRLLIWALNQSICSHVTAWSTFWLTFELNAVHKIRMYNVPTYRKCQSSPLHSFIHPSSQLFMLHFLCIWRPKETVQYANVKMIPNANYKSIIWHSDERFRLLSIWIYGGSSSLLRSSISYGA